MADWRDLIYTAFGTLVLMLAMAVHAHGLTAEASIISGYIFMCGGMFSWIDINAQRKIAKIRALQQQEKMEKRMAKRQAEEEAKKPASNVVELDSARHAA